MLVLLKQSSLTTGGLVGVAGLLGEAAESLSGARERGWGCCLGQIFFFHF